MPSVENLPVLSRSAPLVSFVVTIACVQNSVSRETLPMGDVSRETIESAWLGNKRNRDGKEGSKARRAKTWSRAR